MTKIKKFFTDLRNCITDTWSIMSEDKGQVVGAGIVVAICISAFIFSFIGV